MALTHPLCSGCQGEEKAACKGCLLVVYCSAECQKAHWSIHRQDCRSSFMKDTWQPAWQAEGRVPHFMSDTQPLESFVAKKYLWGNVPAYDVLNLKANEGSDYGGELNLLFAASGDPRHIIKTIASVPEDCSVKISSTINDIDFDVIARNAIMLIVSLTVQNHDRAADCMLHVWYSATLTQAHMDVLCGSVRVVIDEVCKKIADKKPDTVLGKTWHFDLGSLRLVLSKRQWFQLLQYFEVPTGLTAERATQVRQTVTLAHERRDYRDRALFAKPVEHRHSYMRFREYGVLLPFGHSREKFTVPNPTLFQGDDWPMMDSSEPLEGWDYAAVVGTAYSSAKNDVYGKLYVHVRDLLRTFCARSKSLGVRFTLLNSDAKELHTQSVEDRKFARVELSNICDMWCLGPAGAVGHLSRFLQDHAVNPYATFITLFLNAIPETMSQEEDMRDSKADLRKAVKYLPMKRLPQGHHDPHMLMLTEARSLFRDNDKYFDRYMKNLKFNDIESLCGVVIKDHHTIIDKWPTRLKKQFGTKGSEEEFRLLHASGFTGIARYVEWKKAA